MAFDEKKKNKSSVGSLIDLSVPSGAETSLETLEYAWRKLGRESNGERARLAREVTRIFVATTEEMERTLLVLKSFETNV